MVNSGDIVTSKRTGKRFVVTSSRISNHSISDVEQIEVIPETEYSEYLENKFIDSWYGQMYEGMKPWKMPIRELKRTGEVYKRKNDDEIQEHWASMQWCDDGGRV